MNQIPNIEEERIATIIMQAIAPYHEPYKYLGEKSIEMAKNEIVQTLHQQLQKAREEERRKVFLEVLDLPAVGINTIDREDVKSLHHSELDQLNK